MQFRNISSWYKRYSTMVGCCGVLVYEVTFAPIPLPKNAEEPVPARGCLFNEDGSTKCCPYEMVQHDADLGRWVIIEPDGTHTPVNLCRRHM
jgi:hypothetical protein